MLFQDQTEINFLWNAKKVAWKIDFHLFSPPKF